MARKRSTKKKKAKRRRKQPTLRLSNRQGVSTVVHVHNAPARRARRRKRRASAPALNPFQMAQLIPERRHYFSGNQAWNNKAQSDYDTAKVESKIAGQYASLEKKLESLGKLDRTTQENAQSIAQINARLSRRASSAPAAPASSPPPAPAPAPAPARTSTSVGPEPAAEAGFVMVPKPAGPTVAQNAAEVQQVAQDVRARQRAIADEAATTAAARARERARSDVAGMSSQERMASRLQSTHHMSVVRKLLSSPVDVVKDKEAARRASAPPPPPPAANPRPSPKSKTPRNTPQQVRAGARKQLSLSERARRALPGLRGRSKYSPAHNPGASPPAPGAPPYRAPFTTYRSGRQP